MRVLLISPGDGAHRPSPLSWHDFFDKQQPGLDLDMLPEGPERDAIQALVDINGTLPRNGQLMAAVSFERLEADRDTILFTGEWVPRKKGDLLLVPFVVEMFISYGGSCYSAFGGEYRGLNLEHVWSGKPELALDGCFKTAIKNQLLAYAKADRSYTRDQMATNALELQGLLERHDVVTGIVSNLIN